MHQVERCTLVSSLRHVHVHRTCSTCGQLVAMRFVCIDEFGPRISAGGETSFLGPIEGGSSDRPEPRSRDIDTICCPLDPFRTRPGGGRQATNRCPDLRPRNPRGESTTVPVPERTRKLERDIGNSNRVRRAFERDRANLEKLQPSSSDDQCHVSQHDGATATMAAKRAYAGALAALLGAGGRHEVHLPEDFVAQTGGPGELWLKWTYPAPFVRDVQEYHVRCWTGGYPVYWDRCLADGAGKDGPCFGNVVEYKVRGLQPDTWYVCQLSVVEAGEKHLNQSAGIAKAKTRTSVIRDDENNAATGNQRVERNNASVQNRLNSETSMPALLETVQQRALKSVGCSPEESLKTLIMVTEVMSSNGGTLEDEDGDTPDWIEVRFLGNQQENPLICLNGWSLIDDTPESVLSSNLAKEAWEFPEDPIPFPESGRIVLFASGKDKRNASRELHTDFALKAKGEPLTLFFDRKAMQNITLPPIPRDRTFGVLEEQAIADAPSAYQASDTKQWSVLHVPTPGERNSGPERAAGPAIVEITEQINDFQIGKDLVVKATVEVDEEEANSLRAVLLYRIGFGETKELEMDSIGDHTPARSHAVRLLTQTSYEGKIPSSAFQPGDMVRWSITVFDSLGGQTKRPAFQGRDRPQKYGTAIENPGTPSNLPHMEWFVEDTERAETRRGTRCSLMFLGRFYDNIFCRTRGVSSATWPKKKYKFKLHENSFIYREGEQGVSDVNLDSMYDELGEESYMRFVLASAFFEEVGVPVPITFHVRLSQNNVFQGLYAFAEQIDETFLKRNSLDPAGSLYKALGTESNLRPGIQESLLVYHYKKMTEQSRKYNWSDLAELIEALSKEDVETFLFDRINLPQVINEMAAQTAVLNQDRCTKNYFLLRDSRTEEWMRLPWDLDGAFGIGSGYGGVEPRDGYCVLTCEQFNSPLFCDRNHPQDVALLYSDFEGSNLQAQERAMDGNLGQTEGPVLEWRDSYNHLTDALLRVPRTREMYMRRLRSIMDNVLNSTFLADKVQYFADLINHDAKLDNEKWGTGDLAIGVKQLLEEQIPLRRETLFQQYGPDGNGLIPGMQSEGLSIALHSLNTHSTEGFDLQTYLEFKNPNPEALDISKWKISGGVSFVFAPGTVLPSWDSIFVSPDVLQFRQRGSEPHGGQSRFVVGPLNGKLSQGQQIQLEDPLGRVVLAFTT